MHSADILKQLKFATVLTTVVSVAYPEAFEWRPKTIDLTNILISSFHILLYLLRQTISADW
jgi:hypothetical protein